MRPLSDLQSHRRAVAPSGSHFVLHRHIMNAVDRKKSALIDIILSHQRPVAHEVAMAEERIRRRLAAIMVADVVGYARLMEADEAGTLAALKERRKTVLEPVVRAHGGRIVKLMGDGVLVEFGSAVDAVRSSLELQVRMADANGEVADERQI